VRLPEHITEPLAALSRALSPRDAQMLSALVDAYVRAHREHFATAHDVQALLGQDNLFRYVPCHGIALRAEADADPLDLAASGMAAHIAGVRLHISAHPRFRGPLDATVYGHPVRVESLRALSRQLELRARLRLLGTRTPEHEALVAAHGIHLADAPVLPLGRFELLHYLREQSLSCDYHRYGQLGLRARERRRHAP
jgi:RHH-type proline utilization regulon transcriptional repressor/proline dehydrogenase/delta 1-pyrroline-5-carboxylate dehydrogenase